MNPDEAPPRLARAMGRRFALAGVLIVSMAAATTATAGLMEVRDFGDALSQGGAKPALSVPELAPAERGPRTILLMGSDVRKVDRERGLKGNSDTMILVRLDPTKKATALLAIPRDLKVRIPGYGTQKINAAFPEGGVRLTVRTIQQNLGVKINHVVNTNFKGFKAMINRVGCFYVDIDRRYFNDNARAYATIDVKPGYQKMCGDRALDYVRFRHEDTDLVRGARQQDFIRQARNQVGVQKLLGDRKAFLRLFGRYTDTDIRGTQQILSLLKVVAFSVGQPMKEVRFRADVGPSYVTASRSQLRRTMDEFLNVAASEGPRGRNRSAPQLPTQRRRRSRRPDLAALGLEQAKTAGEDQAISAAPNVSFPVLFPRLRKAGSVYVDVPRTYVIDAPEGAHHQAYRIVVRTGELGAYYGIQGTTWQDPPILQNPSETKTLPGGRKLLLYGDGNRLRLVGFKTPRAAYWVSNTLLLSLNNRQMVAIAQSLQRIGAK